MTKITLSVFKLDISSSIHKRNITKQPGLRNRAGTMANIILDKFHNSAEAAGD